MSRLASLLPFETGMHPHLAWPLAHLTRASLLFAPHARLTCMSLHHVRLTACAQSPMPSTLHLALQVMPSLAPPAHYVQTFSTQYGQFHLPRNLFQNLPIALRAMHATRSSCLSDATTNYT